MDRVEQIEAAIESLPPEDFRRLVHWWNERDQRRWEAQMAEDSAAGRLDFLFEEANQAVHDWPPTE